jgi:hypothetical protein
MNISLSDVYVCSCVYMLHLHASAVLATLLLELACYLEVPAARLHTPRGVHALFSSAAGV